MKSLTNDFTWIKKAKILRASALIVFNIEEEEIKALHDERNLIFMLGIV